MITRARDGIHLPNKKYAHATIAAPSPPPTTVRAAMRDPGWAHAMQEEFDALQDNRTWTLVPHPQGVNVITGKWIFKNKVRADGSL